MPEKIRKYLYADTNALLIRFLGLIGLISVLLVAYGYFKFFTLSWIYFVIFGPIALFFIYNRFVRFIIQMCYPKFNIKDHEKFITDFWKSKSKPAVDIFLPFAGEELSVYEETLQGVSKINYTNKNVYVLDDAGNEKVEDLAHKYNFTYLSRPNRGEYKKAGNLMYGYEHSSGKYVLVLDADFVPHKDILKDLIPYLENDPSIGILQTPQYFDQTANVHKRSSVEYGGGNIVEEFYRIDMPSRDIFDAAICVGTSAIYKREAIEKSGGTPKVSGSEDVRQGLAITEVGYKVRYIPLILSIGTSPDSLQGYFRQHNRWCTGSLMILFDGTYVKAKLSTVARLIYLTNAIYYLSEAFSIIFPFQLILLLYFHTNSLNLMNTLWFIPYMILDRGVYPFIKKHKIRVGTRIAALNNVFTYLYTIINLPFGKTLAWEPAGVKIKKGLRQYTAAVHLGMTICVIFLASLIYVFIKRPLIFFNYNSYAVIAWALYTAFWYVIFLVMSTNYIHKEYIKEMKFINQEIHFLTKSFSHFRRFLAPALALIIVLVLFFEVGKQTLKAKPVIAINLSNIQTLKP